ncbi:anthranilate phosphoribosyltransferase [Streptococcus caviae]|uniref:anthranilate phosphoribosyltransferase n=1 Tax=Streptococcus sp. 'caviae' TaxID=1915004 RepID=UPI00094BC2F8|nr:anthranilate phosphoribosyltransferase [Streptococcus sp. 'caviae']OLN84029.1 anthranilate phosphoribosyltransferase [Streptococcus sp. 'caviae']
MKEIFEKLAVQTDLSESQMTGVAEKILKGQLTEAQIAAFLMALKIKGETPEEILGLVKAIKENAVLIPSQAKNVMDNCGTGGDKSFSFNISTTCSFILAGGGIHVAKHGNRSISSKSGSADVLEALGITVDLAPEKLGQILDQTGIAFLFAQKMHPAMRYISPARQALGIPTIMNLIGPLTHPMDLETQLMGLYQADLQQDLAQVLKLLGRRRAVVITGPDNMDEAALYGVNHYTLLNEGKISQGSFTFNDLGMPEVGLDDIKGGDAQKNAQILISVLKNEPSPYLETAVLNAGLGFFANGKADTLAEGIDLAREIIASGKAYAKLQALQEAQVD